MTAFRWSDGAAAGGRLSVSYCAVCLGRATRPGVIRRVLLAVFYVAIVFLLLRFSGLLSREGLLPLVDKSAIVHGPAPTAETCNALCQCKADVHGGRFYCGDDWKQDPFFNEDGIDDDVNSAVDVISDKAAHGDTNSRHSVNRTSNVINFPHICAQNFRNLADVVFGWDDPNFMSPATAIACAGLRPGAVVYVTARRLDSFFRDLYPLIREPFVLVTGASIHSVPQQDYRHLVTGPWDSTAVQAANHRIIHWYGQNGNIPSAGSVDQHSDSADALRFTRIPIGVNCFEMSRNVDKLRGQYIQNVGGRTTPGLSDDDPLYALPLVGAIGENEDDISNLDKLLLINYSTLTDPSGLRQALWQRGCNDMLSHWRNADGTPWSWTDFSLCRHKNNGVQQYASKVTDIFQENLRIPFWLSPRGAGVDCHRHWEALYFGRIPIISSTHVDPIYADLPVIILANDDWSLLSREFLISEYRRIMALRRAGLYDLRKLRPAYWARIVLERSAYKNGLGLAERPARCWRGVWL